MNPTPSNGNGNKVLWWILGGILGPMILAMVNTVFSSTQRLAALEAEFKDIEQRFERIERKIDHLIERR